MDTNTNQVNPPMSWWQENQKYKPQSNAIAPGVLVLVCTGAHFAWGLVDIRSMVLFINTFSSSITVLIGTLVSFFLAAIVGFIVAGFLYGKISTKYIYYVANGLLGLSGIFFIALPNVFAAILTGRILAGFAHGLAYVTVIVHGSEVATPKIRGKLLGSIHLSFISGIFLHAAFTLNNNNFIDGGANGYLNSNTVIGIMSIIMVVLSIIVILAYWRESPVLSMRKKQDADAIITMVRLRSEFQENWSIRNEFNELKAMVTEEEGTASCAWKDGNKRPLFLVLLMKIAFFLAFNIITSQIRSIQFVVFAVGDLNFAYFAAYVIQFISLCIAVFCIDKFGRRKLFLISSGLTATAIVIFGIVSYYVNFSSDWLINVLIGIAIVYDLSIGLGLGMVSDVYGGEAFSSIKKPKSLALVSSVEYLLQAVLIIGYLALVDTVFKKMLSFMITFIIIGLLMVVITIYLSSQLPETAKMSIRQSKNEFLKNGFKFSGH